MNTMQMYDNVLTESIDLVSFSKDNAANQHLQLIISLSFLLKFFFFFPSSNQSQCTHLSPSYFFILEFSLYQLFLICCLPAAQFNLQSKLFPSHTPFLVSLCPFTLIFSKLLSAMHKHWVVSLLAAHWRKSQNSLSALAFGTNLPQTSCDQCGSVWLCFRDFALESLTLRPWETTTQELTRKDRCSSGQK